MCKPWSKMTKDEKLACANHKFLIGVGIFLLGLVWSYFASVTLDVWTALPPTITVMGVLLAFLGFVKRVLS